MSLCDNRNLYSDRQKYHNPWGIWRYFVSLIFAVNLAQNWLMYFAAVHNILGQSDKLLYTIELVCWADTLHACICNFASVLLSTYPYACENHEVNESQDIAERIDFFVLGTLALRGWIWWDECVGDGNMCCNQHCQPWGQAGTMATNQLL